MVSMHWADVEAKRLLARGDRHLISTGISPSGFIHVGSLRESITAEAVRKAVEEQGGDVRMIYLIDSIDPLRRRYSFLPEEFEQHVGRPLNLVPCPCGEHDHYAHHFIQPFLDSLSALGVHCETHWTHLLYREGRFAETIDMVIRKREKVIEILREITGREVPDDYFPYTPRCPKCNRFSGVEVLGYERPYVRYRCSCGWEGLADIRRDQGKLPWRIEWAAKWKIFGVTCEPFGKDHAAAGGSYDTGVRFAREIFDMEPPHPIPYEFIQLKGKGQMHKSSGSVVTGIDALRITPPEVLNFTILRYNPDRHIDYDPGLGVLDAVDEYDRIERIYFEGQADEKSADLLRAYELSQPNGVSGVPPLQVPYRHLVSVVQISDDFDTILEILKRTEHIAEVSEEDLRHLKERIRCVRYWLENFAPDDVKFTVLDETPPLSLSEAEKAFLSCVSSALDAIPWEGGAIHNAVHECATSHQLSARRAFQLMYTLFLGQKSGPRLGHFLSMMERGFVMERIRSAL